MIKSSRANKITAVRGPICWLVLLFWVLATHHCAFADCFPHVQPSSKATSSPSNEFPSNCPEHQQDDTASHGEGRACVGIIQTNSTSTLLVITPAAFNFTTDLIALLCKAYQPTVQTISVNKTPKTPPVDLDLLASSLSLVPNAPPAFLA